jgi:hypothetical protein
MLWKDTKNKTIWLLFKMYFIIIILSYIYFSNNTKWKSINHLEQGGYHIILPKLRNFANVFSMRE